MTPLFLKLNLLRPAGQNLILLLSILVLWPLKEHLRKLFVSTRCEHMLGMDTHHFRKTFLKEKFAVIYVRSLLMSDWDFS